MKKNVFIIVTALICGVVFISCNSKSELNDNEIIILSDGSVLQLKNIKWLKDLIDLSKTDKTGNYIGCIWVESYKGQDIFVTNMGLGSGGIMYWFFDSSGNHFVQKNWGYETCTACNFVKSRHVFFEDVWGNLEEFEAFMLNMKLDKPVYSSFSIPCK